MIKLTQRIEFSNQTHKSELLQKIKLCYKYKYIGNQQSQKKPGQSGILRVAPQIIPLHIKPRPSGLE